MAAGSVQSETVRLNWTTEMLGVGQQLETFNSYCLVFGGYFNLTNMSAKNERGPPLS